MSELPDLSAQKPYALDQLAQLQGKIIQLSKSMVLQRARIERCRQSDLAAARDIYAELSRTRETLVETLAQVQLFLMEMEEYALAKVSGQLRQGLAGFALMSTGYKSVYEALSRFASSLPVGQKTNAAVVGRLMNNIKLGYYPTDPDNIDLLLRGIRFPEGVTTNLLDPCCGCGKALRQLAQGNNCYAYGVELDESRAEEAQTRLHRVGFGSFFHSSISREAFHLLFLNPPYLSVINESGGRSRHEKRFLIESLPALAYGGLLIYVIPYYRLTPDICRILVDNFDDLSVWRFTEREFRKFKQVAVLGIRKPRGTELQDTLCLEELASAPMSIRSLAELPEERYALPDHPINVFNHRTNIDIKNRIVAFDIKELGKQLKKIGMLIVQDQIWGRVTQNRSKGKATWYFCDEFHLLLREEQTAAFSCEIWKRFRKWGGIPTGATQNVKDLLSSPEIENILENSDFICLLNQASGDRKILAERLNISPQQLRYVDNSEPGEGLLIYENVILPFKNPIPKNTQLYQIMTTRLGEGATV